MSLSGLADIFIQNFESFIQEPLASCVHGLVFVSFEGDLFHWLLKFVSVLYCLKCFSDRYNLLLFW